MCEIKTMNKNEFFEKSMDTLGGIFDLLNKAPKLAMEDLESDKTALVIVDMVNGFTREGALQSPRIEKLIPGITALSEKCDTMGITKIAFADCHTEASPEFDAYPAHCITGTSEEEIVDEIKEIGGYTLIPKNSTNGFLEAQFQKWLRENPQMDTFIITGNCTDICIQQFATTLKTWFNMYNKKSRVIVPISMVETYDLGLHDGDVMNVMALYNMITNGIEVVQGINA